jgi:hypothetical protein
MRILDRVFYILIALFILAGLSCGGGGGLVAGGGIGGTGVTSVGEVTAFGSVWVNGVEYDTGHADVYVDNSYLGRGDQAILQNMDVGRIVVVRGQLHGSGSGTAEEVYYTSAVRGPIDAVETIDIYTIRLTVLGQTIIVDDRTRLKGVDADDLAEGNFVDVSGLFDSTGTILAVFLEKTADVAPAGAEYTVTGPVSNLNTAAMTFSINSLAVDYGQGNLSGFNSSGIENGMFVSISGRIEAGGTVFIADTVSPYLSLDEASGEEIEMEGLVGAAISANRFPLNGYMVAIDSNTEFVDGTVEEILPGIRIEVEGVFDSGAIVAEKIKFSALFRAESDLFQKNDVDLTLVLAGLAQITVRTNELTHYIGLAAGTGFDALAPGDHLVIKGHLVEDQIVTASQIIGLPAKDKVFLRGTLTDISDPVLSINGVAVDTDTLPTDGFYRDDETVVSREEFFNLVQIGNWVEVKGQLLAGGSVEWQSITLVQTQ